MVSIARHHNEWLSLLEVSGPFLSMPVLLRAFPQGLDALDKDQLAELRLAYEEWLDNQNSLRPSPAIHSIWVRYVLEHILGFEKEHISEGQAIPAHLKAFVAEQGETLRPDLVIASPEDPAQKPRLLVQVVAAGQNLERVLADKHWKASPAMRMMELLRETGVRLGLVTNGEQWMLVNAPRGETSSFITWYAALWIEEPLTLRAYCSLLGASRFFSVADEDTLEGLLAASANDQQEVTDQLGYQVRRAVEVLIRAVDKADQDRDRALLKGIRESDLYEAALTVMMRLVFLFSAEERGLLLLGDALYDENYAVSTLRARLREVADHQGEEVLERRFDAWCRLLATFRAVHDGIHHDRLNLPAYGGSLFDPGRFPFLEGRSGETNGHSEPLLINNRTVLHLLEALQLLRVKVPGGGPAEARRLSFRSLDVEQIGHVYEGLLDHIALRTDEPVLGLIGTREKEPELPLSTLATEEAKGDSSYLTFLAEQTGRSENALRKALLDKADAFTSQRLQIACNNDSQVYDRVLKYASLVREDDFGYPAVFLSGSVYVTAGATRRSTGTHYTPRSLTEPIVQHTLEPQVYVGPADGLPKEQWKLKSPAELLDLKICDMAMGSAGFLVQVIRYMSERLVESWDLVLQSAISTQQSAIQITPEGKRATGKPGEMIIPLDDEERLILARRLVADRCIYGVDKNPLAVEIAKLSIWLTTMDKGRPFTFLDHALKCGDSLVGADEEMYRRWAFSRKDAAFMLDMEILNQHIETARLRRKELENFTVVDIHDIDQKVHLLKEADEAIARVKQGCDLLVAVHLLGLNQAEQDDLLVHLLWDYVAGLPMESEEAQRALEAARKARAFHWRFEFPEVFERQGFSAFVGNPPFIGGRKIRGTIGGIYLDFLTEFLFPATSKNADLCAFFIRRANDLTANKGSNGFIATSSISEGDTRDVCLQPLLDADSNIFRASSKRTWPGAASVTFSPIWIYKGDWKGKFMLDEKEVSGINAYLTEPQSLDLPPFRLGENQGLSYQGSIPLGKGFVLTEQEVLDLLAKDSKNQLVINPYLIGQELNIHPKHEPSQWIINFHDWPLERDSAPEEYRGFVAADFPDCLQIIRERVLPERTRRKETGEYALRKPLPQKWWIYGDKRPALYSKLKDVNWSLAIATQATKYVAFGRVTGNTVYSNAIAIVVSDSFALAGVLASSFHEVWSRRYGSYNLLLLRYSPSDLFDTYPFPILNEKLEQIGETYYGFREKIMVEHGEGLTNTYNRLHNPKEKAGDIIRLRELQVEIDSAVADAYGWRDIDLGHGFHLTPQGVRFTMSELTRREVLGRLLRLNHERHEEEVRQGLHDKEKKGKNKSSKEKHIKGLRENPWQFGLFGEEQE